MTVIGTKRYRRPRERFPADCHRRQTTLSRSRDARSARHSEERVSRSRRRPLVSFFFFVAEETFVRAAEVPTIFRASGMSRIIIATAYQSVRRRRRERIRARYMPSHDRARNYTRRVAPVVAGLVLTSRVFRSLRDYGQLLFNLKSSAGRMANLALNNERTHHPSEECACNFNAIRASR